MNYISDHEEALRLNARYDLQRDFGQSAVIALDRDMLEAAKFSNRIELEGHLSKGADPDAVDEFGRCALMLVNQPGSLRTLLEGRADALQVCEGGLGCFNIATTPLIHQITKGNVQEAAILSEHIMNNVSVHALQALCAPALTAVALYRNIVEGEAEKRRFNDGQAEVLHQRFNRLRHWTYRTFGIAQ